MALCAYENHKKTIPKIESLLPKQRGNFTAEHLKVLNIIIYVAKTVVNGARCLSTLRALEHGLRRSRRQAENGVLSRVLEVLQKEELIGADFSILSLDSTFVKASPCAAGALKKRAASDRAYEGRSHDQDSRDRRRSDDAGRAKTLAWERWRRARRAKTSPKS